MIEKRGTDVDLDLPLLDRTADQGQDLVLAQRGNSWVIHYCINIDINILIFIPFVVTWIVLG